VFVLGRLSTVLADWVGYNLPFDFEVGLGALLVFAILFGFYQFGPAQLRPHYKTIRMPFLLIYLGTTAVLRLAVTLMPFFISLYPVPTCNEIKGAGFTNGPAWTSSTTEMQGWVSQEYLLHRSQIEVNTNAPVASLNELHWETLKADYWLAHPAEPDTYYPRYGGVFWKGAGARLKDVRDCLGEPTNYLITQDLVSGKPQSLYVWYESEGLIGVGELSDASVKTVDEVAITKMYFGPRDFLRTADDLARSLGHGDISTPLPWTSVEEIQLPSK